MGLGLAVPKMGNLTLVAIVVIALSAVLLLFVVPVLIPQVVGFLQDMGILPGGGEELDVTNMKNAILCSYYRCVDGCESMPDEIKDLEIYVDEEEVKKCYDGFCPVSARDAEGQICDRVKVISGTFEEKSKNFPVEVFIKNPARLDLTITEELGYTARYCGTFFEGDEECNAHETIGGTKAFGLVPKGSECHMQSWTWEEADYCIVEPEEEGQEYYIFTTRWYRELESTPKNCPITTVICDHDPR